MAITCDPWPLDTSCLPTGWSADPQAWDAPQRQSVEVASEILKRFSGGVFGLCTLKVRPCRQRCTERTSTPYYGVDAGRFLPYRPLLIDGTVYNVACGCQGSCGCSALSEILLDPPAYDIVQVRVDGLALSPLAYRVDDYRRLVRLDGGTWPDCQELVRPDTEPQTFSVTYRTGNPVPPGGRTAATILAVQLWKACTGSKSGCSLPERVTQVVREGVTYTLLDNLDMFERGRTGLNRVDMWLASVNPYQARAPMRAWSPDTVRSRRETGGVIHVDPVPGAPGTGYFHWVQDIAVTSLTIDHDLGYRPSGIELYSPDWQIRYENFGVVHLDENRLNITTELPFRGHVILG